MKKKPKFKVKTFLKGLLIGALFVSMFGYLSKDDPSKLKLRHKLENEVVKVTDLDERGSGTGFYFESNGQYYVLTNEHVCDMAKNQDKLILIHKNGTKHTTKILKKDNKSDLCLLEAPEQHGLDLANDFNDSELLYIYGYPLGIGQVLASGFPIIQTIISFEIEKSKEECVGGSYRWVTKEVTMFGQLIGTYETCEKSIASVLTSAVIYPGNSGSPVIDESGTVTGIAFAAVNFNGFGFIIPVWDIHRFMQEFQDGQKEVQKVK